MVLKNSVVHVPPRTTGERHFQSHDKDCAWLSSTLLSYLVLFEIVESKKLTVLGG